jgi:outer membrane protein
MDRLKNGLLTWNLLLTLLVGFLLFKQFSKRKANDPQVESHVNHNSEFRMAYFEMDSVAANFEMVKEVKTELAKKEEENNTELEGLAKKFQQRYLYFQNLARNGNLSQQQSDSANYEIKTMDDNMKLRKQQLDQEYNDLMVRRQNDIKTKIEAYLKDYNKDHNFSYIVSYEQGLFYYKDTAYNITADVIKGLNELYKLPKKK